ncbi:hypothetical protein [Nitrosopumilus sp.]|uniref:hypothetical protein n=1 Tax=Nitrosopumilus sp. TaxID=2024843 RepID=UPI00247EDB6E|nr:hypothetical protein [Nitrosopumilus sp.]MCV0409805.1 hypothetical protein [Nitrosopumilus sp.]
MITQNSVKQESAIETPKVSVCDIMKNNTSMMIHKMETEVPTYMQLYSDLYTKYLEMFDDLFGTCYISEKQFFDKLGLDQITLKTINNFWKTMSENYNTQIDISTNFLKSYVQIRISAIESYEEYMKILMDSYSKTLFEINKFTKFSNVNKDN